MKRSNSMTGSVPNLEESGKEPVSQTTEPTGQTWQEAWREQARKETPERRYLMEEALRRYLELYPEDSGEQEK